MYEPQGFYQKRIAGRRCGIARPVGRTGGVYPGNGTGRSIPPGKRPDECAAGWTDITSGGRSDRPCRNFPGRRKSNSGECWPEIPEVDDVGHDRDERKQRPRKMRSPESGRIHRSGALQPSGPAGDARSHAPNRTESQQCLQRKTLVLSAFVA